MMISFQEAIKLTLENIQPLEEELIDLLDGNQRAVYRDIRALVDSPSINASLKDGYAIHSVEIRDASPERPVILKVVGSIAAGSYWKGKIDVGEAVRILSGAPIPEDADAIVAEEFVQSNEDFIYVMNNAEPGRNILFMGSDVKQGQILVQSGDLLNPTRIGFLAAAGHHEIPVHRNPSVAIMATGDEVIAPGERMCEGKVFASNLVTLAAWCRRYGFATHTIVVPDEDALLEENLITCIDKHDAVLSSGGAWKGEHDLIVRLLDRLGWQKIYHRVRIGPGKAVGFGLFQGKPVFCLPGGPPSNHMAFLQLALPGLQRLAGWRAPGLTQISARLGENLSGQLDWSQFVHGKIERGEKGFEFLPINYPSRLQMMADTDGIVMIPEGIETLHKGKQVSVQILR